MCALRAAGVLVCRILGGVELDLAQVTARTNARADSWSAVGLVWASVQRSPDDGRNKSAEWRSFETREWGGQLIVWDSGEAELEAMRTDGWRIAKHYDFENANDIEQCLDELTALIRDGSEPLNAQTWVEPPR
jgi:hypothetical protein